MGKSFIPTKMVYPGDEKMALLLEDAGSELSLADIKAAIAGSVLSVDMIPPTTVLEMVFAESEDDEEAQAGFDSEEQAEVFMQAFTALWSQISDELMQKGKPVEFSKIPNFSENQVNEWVGFTFARMQEMDLFFTFIIEGGFPYAGEDEEAQSEETAQSDLPLFIESKLFQLSDLVQEIEEGNPKKVGELIKIHREFDTQFAALYPEFFKESLSFRGQLN